MKKLLKCFIFLMFSKAIIASYGMENVVDAEIKDANVWKKVPIEKIEEITNFLPFRDYRTLQVTSKQFNNILHGYGQIITFEDFKSKNNLAKKIIRRLELNYLASGVDFSAIAEELTDKIFTTKVRSRVHYPNGKIEEGSFEIKFLLCMMPNSLSLDFTGCKHINSESFFGLFSSLQLLNKITHLKLSHCTKLDSDRIFPIKKLTNLQELYLDHTSINLINGEINPYCPNSLS